MIQSQPTRRRFLQASTLAGVALSIPNLAKASTSANSKINHANFGASGKAKSDIRLMHGTGAINLVAVAEVDDNRAAWLKKEFPDARIYKDWRVLLDKEGDTLDSVGISTPDHMHAPIAIPAMKRGLHVFGQKPLAHNLYETRRTTEIARETGVVTQMGIQLASTIQERTTIQMIRDGVIGKVEEIHMFCHKNWGDSQTRPDTTDPIPATLDWDLWCGVGPKTSYIGNKYYHPGGWRRRLDYGCGTLGDMGCHIFSPMFGALGVRAPLSVKSLGGSPNKDNWALNEKFEYIFPGSQTTASDTVKVTWHGGTNLPPKHLREMFGSRMPKQGSIFVGTKGILLAPHQQMPVPFPRQSFADYTYPALDQRDHYGDFVAAIQGQDIEPIANFTGYGGPLTETVLLGALASRFPQQTLEWDAENLRITNLEAANQFVKRQYRQGWHIEGLES